MGRSLGSRDHAPRAKAARLTVELIAAGAALYADGLSIRQVAHRLGLSYGGARNAIVAGGCEMRARSWRPAKR